MADPILPHTPHLSVLKGDLNSHHVNWEYEANDENGDM